MIRGTTTSFTFKLPFKKSEIDSVKIKFWQKDIYGMDDEATSIYKYLSNCDGSPDATELVLSLVPSETKRFSDKFKLYAQLSAKSTSGVVVATKRHLITVYPMDDDLVMVDEVNPFPPANPDGWIILDGGAIVDE